MMSRFSWAISVLASAMLLLSTAGAFDGSHITLTIGSATIPPKDTNIVIPVYLSNPVDAVAGVEFLLQMDQNHYVEFDSKGNAAYAVDTAGTLVTGWEWVGISSLDRTPFDIKFAGMVDWPGGKQTPPLAPQEKGLLAKLRLKVLGGGLVPAGEKIGIHIIADRTGFSDAIGNSIGIETKMVKKCREFKGDSCISWRMVKVGVLDTMAVKLIDGTITFSDSIGTVLK
jgi:hypothetical protein